MNLKDKNVDLFFDNLSEEALRKNHEQTCRWTKYKEDLEQTKSTLTWLPKKLKHEALIPIGKKALMRGYLVHTNELLVNLGETWFVKRTASQTSEICDRRIERCDEMLQRLDKERELIEYRRSLPSEQDAFGSDERPEIIEHVTEEEDKKWREEHRRKEKEYRQKLAELRSKESKPIENEEELWKHLDELELQEELEDELNRLNAEYSTDEEETESIDLNESEINSEKIESVSEKTEIVSEKKPNTLKRRVSFVSDEKDSSDEEPLHLEIKFSDVEPSAKSNNSVINSPSDIYDKYLGGKTEKPVSILKKNVNPNKEKELEAVAKAESMEEPEEQDWTDRTVSSGIVFSDVVERNVSEYKNEQPVPEPSRKISKFKASRMKK